MKAAWLGVPLLACLLAGCGSLNTTVTKSDVRSYNATASVGDFVTISLDPTAQTITYKNYTNGENGTVPYTVSADGSYTIADPQGNLLSAYEIPGYLMVMEAANAGPNKDTTALITAIENVPATLQSFAGQSFNMIQFRTRDGGAEIGTVAIDGSGDITPQTYDPAALMWTNGTYFNGGTFPASSVTEDPSGTFFVVHQQDGANSTVFGAQDGLWAIDIPNQGTGLGLPKAASQDFDSTVAGVYDAIYYEKPTAQMQNNVEVGIAVEGKASMNVTAGGDVTISDSQNNVMANGTLIPLADASYIYDGTTSELSDPCYGIFTIRTVTSSSHQDTFVTFQGNAAIFSSFQTALPLVNNGTYEYFYGVGLKVPSASK